MSKRKIEAVSEYFNEALGCMVKVYPEKQVKRRAWMRGEIFIGISQRTDNFAGGCMVPFSRKPGKY